MNQFIDQLANLIPDCNNPSNKPDKLSILKFAATHCESKKESLSGKIQREIHVPALRSGSPVWYYKEPNHILLRLCPGSQSKAGRRPKSHVRRTGISQFKPI